MNILVALIITALIVTIIFFYTVNGKLSKEVDTVMKKYSTPKFYPVSVNGKIVHVPISTLIKMADRGSKYDELSILNSGLADHAAFLEREVERLNIELEHTKFNFDVYTISTETLRKTNTYDQGFEDGLIIGLGEDA